jgi:CP family cyanate transporter-like MFS transporter
MILMPTNLGLLVAAAFVGFTTAMTFPVILALPALLSAPGDVSRTSAGMFTVSYSCAIIIPTVSGALWDFTGRPWTAFVPLCVCALGLTVFGTIVVRQRPAADGVPSPVTK